MDVVYPRCCGIDVHKRSVVACVLCSGPGRAPVKHLRTASTMTADLLALGDWLAELGVTHVAMESTGVYWKPLWNLWEDRFTLLLVNAQHVKAVPGRKTDVKDAEWLADLLRHGLLRGSYVPEQPQRELRELTRYRSSLVHERTAEVNRLQKVLEGANIKLASVASEVLGVSGRDMVEALLAGEADPAVLADRARGKLRQKLPDLQQALDGRVGPHQRFLLAQQLAHIDFLNAQIATVSAEIAERVRPFEDLIVRLDGIPGVGRWTAEVLVAEIGTDMSRFPTAKHLTSWAGLCPGNDESAGKRRGGKTRKGSAALRVALTEAAYAAGRCRSGRLRDRYHQLGKRRGRKKAGLAVGRSILVSAYAILASGMPYTEPTPTDQTERARRRERRLVRELERLGHRVTLEPLVA